MNTRIFEKPEFRILTHAKLVAANTDRNRLTVALPVGFKFKRGQAIQDNRSGSISITSIFFVIFFVMLLGMVMNIGRHANRKIELQNGADAATYSGGVVIARGMNTLAYTNHMLCTVFAFDAYLREARDRDAERLAIARLDRMARAAARANDLELLDRIGREKRLIQVFGNHQAQVARSILPILERILRTEQIPDFQRTLVQSTPYLALVAANEIADRQAPATAGLSGGSGMQAMLWRTDATSFEFEPDSVNHTLPVMDPLDDISENGSEYFGPAVRQRSSWSIFYLAAWNRDMLRDFDSVRLLSGFNSLWRQLSQVKLRQLLSEYLSNNLMYQLRKSPDIELNTNQYIERETMFVGVTYWGSMPERLPGLFDNPMDADDVAYTQIRLFMPRAKLVYDPTRPPEYQIYRERRRRRDLMDQGWTVQIVPATSAAVPVILQTSPIQTRIETPNLGGINVEEFRLLNTH